MCELKILLPNLCPPDPIKTFTIRLYKPGKKHKNWDLHKQSSRLHLHERIVPVVRELVHKAVQHCWSCFRINPVLAISLCRTIKKVTGFRFRVFKLTEPSKLIGKIEWNNNKKREQYQIICFLYMRKDAASNTHHPQKLVNIITWVTNKTW